MFIIVTIEAIRDLGYTRCKLRPSIFHTVFQSKRSNHRSTYVGFLHSTLLQTAIEASFAGETTNCAMFFIQTISSFVSHGTRGRQNTSVRRLDYAENEWTSKRAQVMNSFKSPLLGDSVNTSGFSLKRTLSDKQCSRDRSLLWLLRNSKTAEAINCTEVSIYTVASPLYFSSTVVSINIAQWRGWT